MIAPEDRELLPAAVVEAEGLADWRVLVRSLHARFRTGDFTTGARLVARIAEAADELDHHPDLDLRYPLLDVRLTSHDVGGLTRRDLRLAARISDLAAAEGVAAEPGAVSVLELALDTPDHDRVKPFWRAVLGLADAGADDELADPAAVLPALWFQGTGPHPEPRQRFHLDVWVPADVARERVAAAVDAGGRLVSDAEAPSFWVLADADGNKACVCTWQQRGAGPG